MASPNSPVLQELDKLNPYSLDFQDRLCNTLYKKEYVERVRNLEGDDPAWLINYLDRVRLCFPPGLDAQAGAGARHS